MKETKTIQIEVPADKKAECVDVEPGIVAIFVFCKLRVPAFIESFSQAQKDFYSTKGQDWQSVRKPLWDKSLALEKRVDEYIAHGDAYLQQHQPSLFDK